jgi:shikimate dehydrogenase
MTALSMSVSAHTRLFCLLGDPVSHSMSPAMMNAAFAAAGIDGVYVALQVDAASLETVLSALGKTGCGGANVTAPHKQAVIPFLDELAGTAAKTGSVNTIVFADDRLVGHSTDGDGLVGALEQGLGTSIRDKTVLVFGAGGAARGVLPGIIDRHAARIVIVNRSAEKAEALAGEFGAGPRLTAMPPAAPDVADVVRTADIVLNATALPLTSETFLGVDLTALKQGAVVYDMNYGRPTGEIGRIMAERSVVYSDGLSMLLFQGARSFGLWTKKDPPIEAMRAALGL